MKKAAGRYAAAADTRYVNRLRLTQAKQAQDSQYDNDQTDDVDDAAHGRSFHFICSSTIRDRIGSASFMRIIAAS
ncbi:hypothetical protein ACOI1H_04590 [Loktanella sp. DJP18]|uniref:hypothetical protein n=1 Tax=Loktanella sp. DJP18 TaxID=3409788 RepID=UPI003BB79C98